MQFKRNNELKKIKTDKEILGILDEIKSNTGLKREYIFSEIIKEWLKEIKKDKKNYYQLRKKDS